MEKFRRLSFDELSAEEVEQSFPTPESCAGWEYSAKLDKKKQFVEVAVSAAFVEPDMVSTYTHQFRRYRDGRLVEDKPAPPED